VKLYKTLQKGGKMKNSRGLFLALMLCSSKAFCSGIGADSVAFVNYGANAGFGQGSFPGIVLGMPKGAGPSMGSLDVLSLGKSGDITLVFLDEIIVDGPGYDLAVFENPFFISGDSGKAYVEVAFVELSVEGDSFVSYPFDFDSTIQPVGNPARYKGLAGVWPVNSYEGVPDPRNPDSSGGDLFDLSLVGLENARFVRIIDAGDSIYDGGWKSKGSAGFDLDAAVAMHWTDRANPFVVTDAEAISAVEITVYFSKSLAGDTGFPLDYFKLDGVPLMSGDQVIAFDSTTLKLVLNTTLPLTDTMPVLTMNQAIGSQTGENLLNGYEKQVRKDYGVFESDNVSLSSASISAYPNPFTHKTVIQFVVRPPALPTGRERAGSSEFVDEKPLALGIYDLSGRLVRNLHISKSPNQQMSEAEWDGTDESGKEVATGYYVCRLNNGGRDAFCKVLLFR
jgi:hypothetical protein